MKFVGSFLSLVLALSAGCSSAELEMGSTRHLLQQATNCTSNGRVTENGMSCCFPATYNGVTYNDCWAIDDDPYCYVSTRSSRATLARCQPEGATQAANATVPQSFQDSFGNFTTTNATVPQSFRDSFGNVTTTNATVPQSFRDSFGNFTTTNATVPDTFRSGFGNFTNATTPAALPSNFSSQFAAGIAPAPQPARTNTSNVSSINAQFSNIFEPAPAPSGNMPFAPTAAPAVRYTINDQRCVFPATLSNGTVVYDCFSVPSLTDTSSEASSATGQQYCLVTESANSQPVQCAAPGYRPESVDAPANLCDGRPQRTTDAGATCTFPQRNFNSQWVCSCYSLRNGSEADAASTQSYCIPAGQTIPALCTPLANTSSTNTTVAASSSSEDSSNTGLIVGLAVGIPLGLLAIAGVAGGAWYYTKRRPMARATSFRKWDEGDSSAIAKGAISGKDVVKSGSSLSSVSKYAEPI